MGRHANAYTTRTRTTTGTRIAEHSTARTSLVGKARVNEMHGGLWTWLGWIAFVLNVWGNLALTTKGI